MRPPTRVFEVIAYAVQTYPEKVDAVAVEALVIDSARQNDKRPASIKIAVPDDVVKELRGAEDQRGLLALVRIPREVIGRSRSRIILPGE